MQITRMVSLYTLLTSVECSVNLFELIIGVNKLDKNTKKVESS